MAVDRLKAALDSGIPGCNWIVRFDESGLAQAGEASDLARIDRPGQGYVWLHLDSIDRRSLDVLRSVGSLTPAAREALGEEPNHPFVELSDRLVYGALVDHQYGIDGAKEDTEFLRFAFGPGFLISGRRIPIYSADATRHALADGATAATPIDLFEMMATNLCQCSTGLSREFARTLDRIEDNILIEGRVRAERANLGRARRSVVRLTRQVNGLQSTFERLEEEARSERSGYEEVAASLGQRADALARDAANLRERARMLQDEINAILATETNDRLYTLTVITALLLPATLVTGYFGMNTKALPFAETEHGTFFATLICLAASTGALFILKKMGLAGPTGEAPARPRSKADGKRA
jgi:zinc transporter